MPVIEFKLVQFFFGGLFLFLFTVSTSRAQAEQLLAISLSSNAGTQVGDWDQEICVPVIEFELVQWCFVVSYSTSQSEFMIKGSSTLPVSFLFYFGTMLLCRIIFHVTVGIYDQRIFYFTTSFHFLLACALFVVLLVCLCCFPARYSSCTTNVPGSTYILNTTKMK